MLRYLHRLREAGRGSRRQRPASSTRQNDLIRAASAVKTDPAICIPIGDSRAGLTLRSVTAVLLPSHGGKALCAGTTLGTAAGRP